MYTVSYENTIISADGNPKFAMSSAVITQKANSADSFVFTLPATHPYRDTPQPRSGIVRVKSGGKTLFVGDVVEVQTAFDNSRTFTCQGCLAWLADVCNIRTTAQSTVETSFKNRMSTYNSLCDERRKIKAGYCDNRPTSIVRIFTPDEFITIFEYFSRLVSAKGGLLLPRYEGDDVYLDYISTKGKISGQQIVFGQNLLNLDNFVSMAGTATAVYPIGADGISIADVNDGKSYLVNEALYDQYGMLATPAKFDTDSKTELLSEARLLLSSLAVINKTLELTAFDLHQLDASIDEIEIGDGVQVISAPHGLNTSMTCSSKTIDLTNPANSTVALGKLRQTVSGMVSMGGGTSITNEYNTTIPPEIDTPIVFNSSVTTRSEIEVYGSTPHIDFHFNNSDDDYTTRIIETASGKLNISAPNGVQINGKNGGNTAVTLTVVSSRLTNLSYTAKYNELLGAVFVRIYGVVNAEMTSGTIYPVLSIGSYEANYVTALTVNCTTGCRASVRKDSNDKPVIALQPTESGIKGKAVYIAGFWFA